MPKNIFNQNKEDLIHDINSAVMAVTETLKLIGNKRKFSWEETVKFMPLVLEKMDELNNNWEELKKNHL